jgi:flavin-binding protein dodecin
MAGHIYKTIDLVGTSEVSIAEAVRAAVDRASQTLKGLDWFELGPVRGRIENGKVTEFQASVRIGFRVMTDEELKASS